jgi:hypothetical protein
MLSSALLPAGRSRTAAVSRRVIKLAAFVRGFVAVIRALLVMKGFMRMS